MSGTTGRGGAVTCGRAGRQQVSRQVSQAAITPETEPWEESRMRTRPMVRLREVCGALWREGNCQGLVAEAGSKERN